MRMAISGPVHRFWSGKFSMRFFHVPVGKSIRYDAKVRIDMGRPRKEEGDRRSRWAVLNVTRKERATIIAYAREAGLSVCAYIVRRALQRPTSPRQDWQQLVRQQAQLLQRLDAIATALVASEPVRDVGAILLILRRIEAEICSWGSGSSIAPGSEDRAGDNDNSSGGSTEC